MLAKTLFYLILDISVLFVFPLTFFILLLFLPYSDDQLLLLLWFCVLTDLSLSQNNDLANAKL